MNKVIGVIPARYGSSRFPGKPLANLCGKPLIVHVYDRALKSNLLSKLIVATDDERIQSSVRTYGGETVMTRIDHQSGTDRIAEAVENLAADIVVNIQGDEPLIEPEMIDEVVMPLLEDESVWMATLKKKITSQDEMDNPNVVKVVTDKNDFALYFSRSLIPYPRKKSIKSDFYKHIGIYAYRKEFLLKLTKLPIRCLEKVEELEQLRVLENGYRIKVAETKFDTVAVDTPEDLVKVEQLMKNISRKGRKEDTKI